MASMRELSVGRSGEIYFFNPNSIEEIPGFNPRNYDSPEVKEHIESIARAIVENGIMSIDPITVQQRDGKLYVLRGHCRRRAHILAEQMGATFKGIRAYVDSNATEEDRTLDLLTSNSGLSLTPLEKSQVVKRLFKFGWDSKEVARKMGVSVSAVNQLVVLDDAPDDVKELVKGGAVSSTLAIETIQERGKEAASEALQEAVETAKEKGKTKATAKDMPKNSAQKVQKVKVQKCEGLARYTSGTSNKSDYFEPDPDAGDFPCGLCLRRTELDICQMCRHFIDLGEADED